MLWQALALSGCLIASCHGQRLRGAQYRRQAAESGNGASTTSTAWNSTSSTTQSTSSASASASASSSTSSSSSSLSSYLSTTTTVLTTRTVAIVVGGTSPSGYSTTSHTSSTSPNSTYSSKVYTYAPSGYTPSSYTSSSYASSAYTPSGNTPSGYTSSAYTLSGNTPSSYTSSAYTSSAYTSSAYTSSAYTSSAYASSAYPSSAYTPSGYKSTNFAASPVGPATASASGNSSKIYVQTRTKPAKSSPSNGACSGTTLNVLNASLDWWYTRTLYNAVSTFQVQFNGSSTGWTLVPAATSFDVNSALASPTCTSSLSYDAVNSETVYAISCFAPATPVAAGTTIITQTAYRNISRTSGTGNIPAVVVTPTPATIAIPTSGGAYASGTPFVYFSAYEIITKSEATYGNGSVGCAEATQAYSMEEPFSFEYTGGDVNGTQEVGAGVTGDVAPAFLAVVGQTGAAAGSWVAAPTVALVVQDVVAAQAVLAAAGPLTSAASLETPKPTLPSFLTPAPHTKTGNFVGPTGFSGHVESSASFLQLPGPQPSKASNKVIQSKSPQWTIPSHPNTTPVSHVGDGGKPKTSGVGGGHEGTSRPNNNASPSNALGVLTQAAATFTHTNPTASAIWHGLGGPTPSHGKAAGSSGVPPIVVGGTTITAHSALQFVVGSSTLTPGGMVVVGGSTVKLNSGASAVVINGVTSPLSRPAFTPASVIVIGGSTFSANSASAFQIAGQTLTPGGVITFSGTTVSLAAAGKNLVINGHTSSLAKPLISPSPVIVVGGSTFSAGSGSTFIVDGKKLTPGGVITVDGSTISLAPAATAVVINGQTSVFSNALSTSAPVLTVGGTTYAPSQGPTYVIRGETLTPGGDITVDGTTISLGQGASSVVVDGLTQSLGSNAASATSPPVLTIGGETLTAMSNGKTYVINGETLTPGEKETVVIKGKTYVLSLDKDATVMMVETEGPNGKVTATSYETLYPAGGPATVTSTVRSKASAGAKPSKTSASTNRAASLANGASTIALQISGTCIAVGSLVLALCL